MSKLECSLIHMSIRNEVLNDILEELSKARSKPPCGLTITQLAKKIGVSRTVVRMHLVALETKNLVESVKIQNALVFYIKAK